VRRNFCFDLYTLASSKPQVTGDISPGLTSLNRKNLPIVVTLGGVGSCYASLASIFKPFDLATNYAITGPITSWSKSLLRYKTKPKVMDTVAADRTNLAEKKKDGPSRAMLRSILLSSLHV
jgi:hypothetical protein